MIMRVHCHGPLTNGIFFVICYCSRRSRNKATKEKPEPNTRPRGGGPGKKRKQPKEGKSEEDGAEADPEAADDNLPTQEASKARGGKRGACAFKMDAIAIIAWWLCAC